MLQTLTADVYGESFLSSGLLDIWGNTPASVCTSNADYGCFRQGTGTNYINPIQSARLRTVHSFNFRYGRVEVEAKMPKGDWLWPGKSLPQSKPYFHSTSTLGVACLASDVIETKVRLDILLRVWLKHNDYRVLHILDCFICAEMRSKNSVCFFQQLYGCCQQKSTMVCGQLPVRST